MKRIVLAGLLGGIVVFFWGALAHMVLPIGMMGMQVPADAAQQDALAGLQRNFSAEGVYMLPALPKEQWSDEAAADAFAARAAQQPYAFVVYQPQGTNYMERFPILLAKQAAVCILAALLAAWLVSMIAAGYIQRSLIVGSLGLFAWLVVNVPYWSWYRFPFEFTVGAFLEQVIGWLLAGYVIAWVLKPRTA